MTEMGFIDKLYKKIGDSDINQDVSGHLSTGYLPLNFALSGMYSGGLPMGRISEIFGPESSGKTLLATMAMIETQKLGGLALFLDFEHAFSIKRACQLGLVTDRNQWIYKQPNTAEEGFSYITFTCDMVEKEGITKPVTIVADSVASMITDAEMVTEIGDENMKTRLSLAACMSSNLKKLAKAVNKTSVTLIFLNQTRDNPGVMFGDKTSTPGGKALKFYASCRVKLHKEGKVKDGEAIVGEKVVAQVAKNKVFEPFREAAYISSFKEGINLYRSHMDALQDMGLLKCEKGWYEFEGKKAQAKKFEGLLRGDDALYGQLLKLFDGKAPAPAEPAAIENEEA